MRPAQLSRQVVRHPPPPWPPPSSPSASPTRPTPATRRPAPADGPPPPYTPSPAAAPPATASADDNADDDDDDDAAAFLAQFDIHIVVDDSSSMRGARWAAARAALATIADVCAARDRDGVDVHFLNAEAHARARTAPQINALFDGVGGPRGATPTGAALARILTPYLARFEAAAAAPAGPAPTPKPLNIIVITDGAATDDVESVLVAVARRLDRAHALPWQVGVQFFQVGDDARAAAALRVLDDDLAARAGEAGLRDMVDTVPWREEGLDGRGILKVVLGAVHRRYDLRGA